MKENTEGYLYFCYLYKIKAAREEFTGVEKESDITERPEVTGSLMVCMVSGAFG